MKNTFDVYSKYHNKIDVSKIVPGHKPIIPRRHKEGVKRLTNMHVRAKTMITPNLLTGEKQKRENPLPPDFKSILELSTRSPYCVVSGTTILIPPKFDKKTRKIKKGFTVKKIEELKKGEEVAGFNLEEEGMVVNKILKIHKRKAKTVKVILNNHSKRTLCCSEDHPLFTQEGWKMAKDLTTKDEIFYYFEKPQMRVNNPMKEKVSREKVSKSIKKLHKNPDYRKKFEESVKNPDRNEKIRNALRKGNYQLCPMCGTKHWVPDSMTTKLNFCSKNCIINYFKSDEYSLKMSGSGNPNWRGGLSFEPYPEEFNDRLKEKVRNLWGRTCALCDKPEDGEKLSVHHINGDKSDCRLENLVPLHRSCHCKTLTTDPNRIQDFEDLFKAKINEILDPGFVEVKEVKVMEVETVYNFELDGTNTYFANGFLSHNCPIPFVLDTMMGVCSYQCRYCFQAQSLESLMTSFFDSDAPLAPRYAKVDYTKKYLNDVLSARGVEPSEREKMKGVCGSISDNKSLKKAAAQRIPLRFGTRSENFLPPERKHKVALEALRVIKDHDYPVIINTKSDLILEEPYFSVITSMDNVAIQETISHMDDKFAKALEPGAPSSSRRWEVLKAFNDVGVRGMVRMEPCAHFLNADDKHLKEYMEHAKCMGCKHFMGDTYHHTVKAEQVQNLFYEIGVDFARMWESTSEYQILGSLAFEKAMYYAKKNGIKCGTFNYHSVPWNDDPVCCMVGDAFKSWSGYSMINFLRNEFVENPRKNISFSDLDEKYYGIELHPAIRDRIKEVWNMKKINCFNPDFMEGMIPVDYDSEGNIVWRFEPKRLGQGYRDIMKMFKEAVI